MCVSMVSAESVQAARGGGSLLAVTREPRIAPPAGEAPADRSRTSDALRLYKQDSYYISFFYVAVQNDAEGPQQAVIVITMLYYYIVCMSTIFYSWIQT